MLGEELFVYDDEYDHFAFYLFQVIYSCYINKQDLRDYEVKGKVNYDKRWPYYNVIFEI